MSAIARQERLMNVVLGPHISEKTTTVGERDNQVVFRVRRDATKQEIRAAVEMLFEVEVEGVQVVNHKGKFKRFGQTIGKRPAWKKAYVKLAAGSDIDFLGTE